MSEASSKCQFFSVCGGCKYLNLNEEVYQKNKSEQLQQFFAQYNIDQKIDFFWIAPPNRRRVRLHIDKNNKIGFFKKSSREIVNINKCFVAEDGINKVISQLQQLINKIATGKIADIQITNFDNIVDIMLSLKKDLAFKEQQLIINFAKDNQVNISTIYKKQHLNLVEFAKNKIFYQNSVAIDLDSNIFLQASRRGMQKIIALIRDELKNSNKNLRLADLYSGYGSYAFAVADQVQNISLFEGDQQMTKLIKDNIKTNQVAKNFKVAQRDLFNFPVSKVELKDFDLAIINPPRNGASSQIAEIGQSRLKKIIYISCSPKTFVRDFLILQKNGFIIKQISAIDQFYSTDHFELMTIIEKV